MLDRGTAWVLSDATCFAYTAPGPAICCGSALHCTAPHRIVPRCALQGVTSPLMGQMAFRASLFGAFGASKRWLATNADGSMRPLKKSDFYKAGAMTGFVAAFTEGPIDFYKSQLQVQIIKSKMDPGYKRESGRGREGKAASGWCSGRWTVVVHDCFGVLC